MTMKHIQDAIEIAARQIAFEAYLLGMKHTKDYAKNDIPFPEKDELKDLLEEIVRKQLEGKNE